jgi:hypothetical protein
MKFQGKNDPCRIVNGDSLIGVWISSDSLSISEFINKSGHINSPGKDISTGEITLENFSTLNRTKIKWITTERKVNSQPEKGPDGIIKSYATIQRIIETRHRHKSCWGVLIQLDKLSFNKTVKTNELSIIEQKHDRDIKDIMTWRVEKSRHKLTIKFKKGCGDFGSGNIVDVIIKSSAISGLPKEDITLSISTDI